MRKVIRQLAKITILTLLSLSLYLPTPAVFAADTDICQWVNYQSGSAGDETVQYSPAKAGETDKEKEARSKAFKDAYDTAVSKDLKAVSESQRTAFQNKIVVITEETLGKASNNFSTSCARVTTCSMGYYDLNKPNQIRKCFTAYDTIDKCNDTAPPSIADISDASKPYKYCEIVQIYFSDGGTSLLYGYIGQIYRYIAYIGGFIAVFILILGGVMRSSAGDNSEMISKANSLITRCITGLVVLFLSAVILYTINPNFFVF